VAVEFEGIAEELDPQPYGRRRRKQDVLDI
jgi:hypothetical protein